MSEKLQLVRRGRAWVFGDDVLNDGQIMDIEMTRQVVYDPAKLAPLAMCGLNPAFAVEAKPGDFVVAGRNFGRGPMHIQGAIALKALDVSVVSESMARSFFRLGVSVGLRVMPFSVGIRALVADGDEIEVDFIGGRVVNHTRGCEATFAPMPAGVQEIVLAGGEQAWLKDEASRQQDTQPGSL
jgi:3-isopropylmalate/(R)-2-methylmalate dehydratase small subunit